SASALPALHPLTPLAARKPPLARHWRGGLLAALLIGAPSALAQNGETEAPPPAATSQMPAPADASEQASENEDLLSYELAPVVVTATRAETDVESAPASVSVITNEQLRTAPVGDLSDAIRHTPGIS